MARTRSYSLSTRQVTTVIASCAVFICLMLLLRGPLAPNPQANFFFKAQQLQAQGLIELALKHYRLISEHHPESPYAPDALKAQADIITGLARKNGVPAKFEEAIILYKRLADTYSNDRAAGPALLTAAAIADNDLNDTAQARALLQAVLERYPNNTAYASQATLKLGRLALNEGQKDEARTLLQSVLQSYPTIREACAEAQYHLGVLYETLFKNKLWAKNAYVATYERYPRSLWAATAQERLGLLYFKSSDEHPERMVLIEVDPLPDEGNSKNSIMEALRPILAARGLSSDATTLRGWSLEPFWGAFDPRRPGRVVEAPFSAFNNVASSANLLYDRRQSADEKTALSALQSELDAVRPVMIYNGTWQLVVGYDSRQQEVFVLSRGARVQAISVKQFLADWKRRSNSVEPLTMMSFFAPGEKGRVSRVSNSKAQNAEGAIARGAVKPAPLVIGAAPPEPTPTPLPTQAPLLGLRPAFVFQLKPLSNPNAHRRALRRAVALMNRAGVGDKDSALLNLEALDALADELESLAKPAKTIAVAEMATAPPTESPVPLPEAEGTPITPAATATPNAAPQTEIAPMQAPQKLARAQALRAWFGAPLQSWITARRDAASYLSVAATALKRPLLTQAAANLRTANSELAQAASLLSPTAQLGVAGTLSDEDRRLLTEAARHLRAAYQAEKNAVAEMAI